MEPGRGGRGRSARRASLLFAASIGAVSLSACGMTVRQRFDSALVSLSSARYMQATIRLHVSGPNVPASAAPLLRSFSLRVEESSVNGSSLAKAGVANINTEMDLLYKGTALMMVRAVGQRTEYFKLDLTPLETMSGIPANTAQSMAAAQVLLGGRWFSLPTSALMARTGSLSAAQQAKAASFVKDVFSAIRSQAQVTSGPGSGGVTAKGNLAQLVSALRGPYEKFVGHPVAQPKGVTGQWSAVLQTSGSRLTSATVSLHSKQDAIAVDAAVTHNPVAIKAPSSATPFPTSLLNGGQGLG